MARSRTVTKTKPTSKTSARSSKSSIAWQVPRSGMFSFLAAFAGVIAAVPLTVAVMMPMMRQDMASAVAQASKHVVSVAPASDTLSCSQPTGAASGSAAATNSGHVLGASTAPMPMTGGGQGGGSQQTPPPFVVGMIGGSMTSTGSISGTLGDGAKATVSSTQTANTTINNNTNLNVSSSNYQDTSSGNVSSNHNTDGGTATSGDASSSNSTDVNFDVKNN